MCIGNRKSLPCIPILFIYMNKYLLIDYSGIHTPTKTTEDKPQIYKKNEKIYVSVDHPDYINLVRRRLADRARKIGDL
jgi:hypothetical protein